MDHNQSDVDVPAGGRLPVIGQEPCQPAAAELRDKQRKSSEAHDRCVLKARFDIETAVIHDKYVWCDSYDRGATIRVPLIDDDVDWHADMDFCEPHYWEKDGNVLVKAGVRSDLLQKDLDFIEELRLMFPRAYREREKARAVVLAGFERTSEAAKVEMERTDECERASRARHGRGGYRKVWDGTVVGPEKKRMPAPAAHVDVEKAKIDAAVAKLESQIKLEEKKRELRRLQKTEEPKKSLEARQAEDAVSMARLKCEHDFVYADLDRPLSTWEVNKLASGGDQIETAEDFVAEGLADGIECPRVSCYSFGQADYIRLFEDRRDHTYRASSVYGEGFTLRTVTQTTFGPRTFSSSKVQRIWGAVIYLLLRVLYYIDLIYHYILREHMTSYIWLLKKRTASVQYEGKICWQLYLELLSRKVIGVKPDAYTTYKRMLTRYQNYSTLNLPAELNGTGVLENTFRLAFSRFCAMNNYRIDVDFIFPETDDADSINESSSDTISEMLVCPLSGESRIVCVQFAAVPMRPIETLRSPRAWVLWFLGLFRPCQAAATYGRPNSVCVNVLALIMAWSLAQLLIGFASLPKSTVSEISLRWQQMRYQQSGYGSMSLTILLSAALISWRLPPEAGLMLMTMVWVLSIVAERRRLTRLSKPSSIAMLKHLASFVPALITRSVFTVLLLLPLSMGFTTLTTTLSNMFLSLTGLDTSAELSVMAKWSLRVITVLLSAILLKISCTLLNLCCTDIFSRIFITIMDWILAVKKGSTRLLRLYQRLTKYVFWGTFTALLLLACLARCSPASGMASQTSWSCFASWRNVASVALTESSRATMDSTPFPNGSLTESPTPSFSQTEASMLSWLLERVSMKQHSALWCSIRRLCTFSKNLLSPLRDLVGSLALTLGNVPSGLACFARSLHLFYTNVLAVLSSELLHFTACVLRQVFWPTGLSSSAHPITATSYLLLCDLIVAVSLFLVLVIGSFLVNISTYLRRNSSELSKNSRSAKT